MSYNKHFNARALETNHKWAKLSTLAPIALIWRTNRASSLYMSEWFVLLSIYQAPNADQTLIPQCSPQRQHNAPPSSSHMLSRSLLMRRSTDSMSFASSVCSGLYSAGMCERTASRPGWKLRTADEIAKIAFFRTLRSVSAVANRTRTGRPSQTRSCRSLLLLYEYV
jgi:hypothetical protein